MHWVGQHLVATHHQIGESNVVVRGDLARRYPRVQRLFVELDVLEDGEGQMIVAEQALHTAKTFRSAFTTATTKPSARNHSLEHSKKETRTKTRFSTFQIIISAKG